MAWRPLTVTATQLFSFIILPGTGHHYHEGTQGKQSPRQHLLISAHRLDLSEAWPSLPSSCTNTVLCSKASEQKCSSQNIFGWSNGQFTCLQTNSTITALSNGLKRYQHSQVQYNTRPFTPLIWQNTCT